MQGKVQPAREDRLRTVGGRDRLRIVDKVRHGILGRGATAAFLAVWLLVSQHCLIGGMPPLSADPSHACCQQDEAAKSRPETSDPADTNRECCRLSAVTVPVSSAAPVAQLHDLWLAWVEAPAARLVEGATPAVQPSSPGPPGAGSFAELVLNRSLLAHAPPFFVVV